MSLEFERSIAEEYCIKVADGTHDSPKEVDYGKKLVTSKNIIGGKLDLDKSYFISLDDFDEINKRSKVDKWDILISMIGTVGEVALITEKPDFAIKNVGLLKNNNEYKAKWLYYYLKSDFGQYQIKSRLRGTTQLYIPLKDLRKLEISVPKNHDDMIKIIKILDNIDKKIENNHNINNNLEEIIHFLYNKFFIKNNTYNNNSNKKWKYIKLNDLIIRNREKIKEFEDWKDELLIDLSNMPRFSISITNFDMGEKFKSNIYKLEKYDLLFGSIRPYFGKVGFSPINGVVTGTVHSFKPKKDYYFSLVLSLISSKDFINYTVSVSKGTKMPSVKWEDFVDYEIFIPEDLDYIRKFDNLVFPLIKKIDYNIHEIQKLKKLRDTLLPKLMSGEIDVSKINCDLKLIIKKIILKFITLFIGGFKYENKNNIKNSKSNETFFKPRPIFKINKQFIKLI